MIPNQGINDDLSPEIQERLVHEVKKGCGMGVVMFFMVVVAMLAIPAQIYRQTRIIEMVAIFMLLLAGMAVSSRIAATRINLARECFQKENYQDCVNLCRPFLQKALTGSNLRFDRRGEATYILMVSADKTGDKILASRCQNYLKSRPGLGFSKKATEYKISKEK